MPKLIVVLESRSSHEVRNFLNLTQGTQDLPEGVVEVAKGVWLVEFPKCALFLSKILVTAEDRKYTCSVYELASPSDWEFVQLKASQ